MLQLCSTSSIWSPSATCRVSFILSPSSPITSCGYVGNGFGVSSRIFSFHRRRALHFPVSGHQRLDQRCPPSIVWRLFVARSIVAHLFALFSVDGTVPGFHTAGDLVIAHIVGCSQTQALRRPPVWEACFDWFDYATRAWEHQFIWFHFKFNFD